MDEAKRCTATVIKTGERCKRARIPGTTVCATHGGSAPQVRAAAQRRVQEARARELAESVGVDVPQFASATDVARYLLERVSRRSAQFGALADASGDVTYTDRTGRERVRAAFAEEQRWLGSLAKVLGVMVTSAHEERSAAAVGGEMVDAIVMALSAGVADALLRYRESIPAAMMAEMAEAIQQAVSKRLLAIEAGAGQPPLDH
jgi:hypothetical protein